VTQVEALVAVAAALYEAYDPGHDTRVVFQHRFFNLVEVNKHDCEEDDIDEHDCDDQDSSPL